MKKTITDLFKNRKIQWVAAVDPSNHAQLMQLEEKMQNFYANAKSYYDHMSFNDDIWKDPRQIPNKEIVRECKASKNILEVGCGRANIVKHHPALEPIYTGIEFSANIIMENQKKYPRANFKRIETSNVFPFPNASFDLVFSHFVIEHVIFPHLFLQECIRVLKPGGTLIVYCPNFVEKGGISSQFRGLSPLGSGREKLMRGKFIDAVLTFYDNNFRLRRKIKHINSQLKKRAYFYINTNPICLFLPRYFPDFDAVYLTSGPEIQRFTENYIQWQKEYSEGVIKFCDLKKEIFIKGKRKFL